MPVKDGYAPFKAPHVETPCSTYYQVHGDLSSPPLICVHGGPGGTLVTVEHFVEIWNTYKIPVILYDQVGCGKSSLLEDTAGDAEVWQISLFVAELNNLIDHLQLRDLGYYVLGVSFGGYIVPSFAADRPLGLQGLIIGSGAASKALAYKSFDEIRAQFPLKHQTAIQRARAADDYQSRAYLEALKFFIRHYLLRFENASDELVNRVVRILDNPVKKTLSGPCPFFPGGTNATFSNIERLHLIDVPTLIWNAEYDTNGRDVAQHPFFELIPRVRWVKFDSVGHTISTNLRAKARLYELIKNFMYPPGYDTEPEAQGTE